MKLKSTKTTSSVCIVSMSLTPRIVKKPKLAQRIKQLEKRIKSLEDLFSS